MLKFDKKTIFLLLLFGGVIAGITYLLYASNLFDLFINRRHLVNFFREHHTYAALIFVGLQALQVVAAPVPGEVTGFAGGIFFGPVWGVVYSTIGLTIGSWIAFMLARLLGRPLVERMISLETIQRYDYVMKHKGLLLAFLMFLIPGFPKDFLCYLLGLGHMRQRDFLLISATGRLLGTVLLTMGGTYFRDARYGALFTVVGLSLAIILLVMIYRDRVEQLLGRMTGALRKDGKDKSPPE
ncbi:MAG TPA: TVP38/TMEM64 family protein [Candidatus Methylomirabilis sp.]|nr:TVP38/TMEM64 family protein [Candidatus Methylomirabilis sp.]